MPNKWRISRKNSEMEAAFDNFYAAVFRYFRYRGEDADTANDLASTVFERALANIHRFDPQKAQMKTWLFSIARNVAINHWKSTEIRSTMTLNEDLVDLTDFSPEDAFIITENKELLLHALQDLDPRANEIIALKFGGPFTNRQIAHLMGLSEQNVAIIVYRSLIKLRSLLANAETRYER